MNQFETVHSFHPVAEMSGVLGLYDILGLYVCCQSLEYIQIMSDNPCGAGGG